MPIVEFIEKNYVSIISLNDISNVLHMNKNYICKIFKIATNKTIMDYLNFVRVENAKALLKSGISIFQVSSSVGFSSQSYFNKVFKKYILCTPSEYKKRFIDMWIFFKIKRLVIRRLVLGEYYSFMLLYAIKFYFFENFRNYRYNGIW